MVYAVMAARKLLDERHVTRAGATIRVEAWDDPRSGAVVRYNLAYVNAEIATDDNGRILGFDNSHWYPGFGTAHHCHWMGRVRENRRFLSFEHALVRFQRLLGRLKKCYGSRY